MAENPAGGDLENQDGELHLLVADRASRHDIFACEFYSSEIEPDEKPSWSADRRCQRATPKTTVYVVRPDGRDAQFDELQRDGYAYGRSGLNWDRLLEDGYRAIRVRARCARSGDWVRHLEMNLCPQHREGMEQRITWLLDSPESDSVLGRRVRDALKSRMEAAMKKGLLPWA